MTRRRRTLVWMISILLVIGMGLSLFISRLALEGQRAMLRSDVEFDAGRLRESLAHARRAASLYAPGLNHVARADARLDAIAAGAESSQLREVAILAWQAVRSTELQRQLGRPSDRARRAERRLALLLADDGKHGSLVEQQQFSRQVEVEFRKSAGHPGLRGLAQVVTLGALFAGFACSVKGLGPGLRRRKWGIAAAGLIGAGTVAWAILLLLA